MFKKLLSSSSKKQLHISLIALVLTIVAVITAVVVKTNSEQKIITADMIHSKEYETVESEDEGFDNCEFVKFTAFFTKDLDGNGTAEKLLGSCTNLNGTDTLYMDINVLSQGYLKDGKISIDGKNFDLNMSMIRDDVLKYNYISRSVKNIELNQVNPGTQKLIMGNITPKLENNINNYSKDSQVVFTGTYVDDDGNETALRKEINLKVEWYGNLYTTINGKNHTSVYNFYTTQLQSNSIELEVSISENTREMVMKENSLTFEIPSLKGYDATEVKCLNDNVTSNYDDIAKTLTIKRESSVNEEGIVTQKVNYINTYRIQITYPQDAFDSIENYDEISMPVSGYYVGYNLDADEFDNPMKSNIAEKTFSLVFEKEPIGEIFNFKVNITSKGLVTEPFYGYALSKQDLIDLYNGQNIEKFEYTVSWTASRGDTGEVTNVTMKEKQDDENYGDKYDGNSFANYVSNKALYFGATSAFMNKEGTVSVYDNDTNELIKTFTYDECRNYSSASSAYVFDESVKHVRVEVVGGNKKQYFSMYFVKSMDLEKLKQDFTLEQIEAMDQLTTYIQGTCYNDGATVGSANNIDSVKLIALRSNLKINIMDGSYSTQENYTNQTIRIYADKSQYGDALWHNGQFLVKMPKEIIKAKINSVTASNEKVTIAGYDLYEEDNNYYLRIITESEEPTTYIIYINYDFNVDPRTSDCTRSYTVYGYNENCERYIHETKDVYDINANQNTNDYVAISSASVRLVSPTSLITLETISNYNDNNDVTVAPNVAEFDKETSEATVNVSITNNYNNVVKDITIMGKVPKANNKYVITKKDLGSNFDTYMTADGIKVPDAIKNITTVYYSTKDNCSYDYTNAESEWKTKDQVTNFKAVRSYLIVLNNYELPKGVSHNFTYDITIEDALNYNDVAFSTHAVKYELATDNGTLSMETEPNRVGIRIVRKYNLNVTKYKAGTNFVAPGNTYAINELNGNNEVVNTRLGTTDANGNFIIKGIYIDTIYTLQEIKASKDYELNDDFIIFKVKENAANKALLEIEILSQDQFKTTPILSTNENGVDVFTTSVEDEPKYTLTINKKDENGALPNAWFTVEGKAGGVTNTNGKLVLSGLSPNEEYILSERRSEGHYLLDDIKFKLVRNDLGNYTIETDSSEIRNVIINNTADVPQVQVSVDLNNETIPTYKLKVLKIEDSTEENKKYLAGAKFVIKSADSGSRAYYTTNENGEIIIDNLFAYVDGKNISGLYTLQEVKAPNGYSNNAETIEFKVTKSQSGYSISIVNESILNTIYNKSVEGNIATITISDKPMFKLVKTDKETNERLANVNFVIYEIDDSGNFKDYAKDVNNEYIGNLIEDQYVVTTDENGEISLPIKDGKYQMYELDYKGYKKNNTLYGFTVGEETATTTDPYAEYFTLADTIPESTGGTIEINYIEDLVDMAIATDTAHETEYNNTGTDSPYANKYIKLMRNLDFNQDSSYRNANDTTTYGDYNGNGATQTIKEELTTSKGWLPIFSGTYRTSEGITFDGQGFEIRNIYHDGSYTSSKNYGSYGIGFFETPGSIVVKNLGVTGNFYKVGTSAGLIAYPSHQNSEKIYVLNCYNKVNITAGPYSPVGGIIGDAYYVNGSIYIDNCYNAGNLIGGSKMGGMIAYRGSGRYEIRNSHNEGNIQGSDNVGGLTGYDKTAVIVNCYNTGKISGGTTGGLVGYTEQSNQFIANCYNTGDVSGTQVGGISGGTNYTTFERCFNTGNITGINYSGGIAVYTGRVSQCFNTGNVIISGSQQVGGICARAEGVIEDCYNEGNIETTGGNASGICPYAYQEVKNSLNTGKLRGSSSNNITTYGNACDNCYYIDTTKVSIDDGIEITEEYSKSIEFYNRLNTSGAWVYTVNSHPKLKVGQIPLNITEGTKINIENSKEEYRITTDVNDIGRTKGGEISGENATWYETVKYKESNSKEIVMTPWTGYEIIEVTINGEKINFETDGDGVFKINPGDISDVQENKHVVVTYGLTNQIYTLQKVDKDDESIKLEGAEFFFEQIEDYSPQVQVGELENTSTEINRIIRHEDNAIEGVLGDIVSSGPTYVKSGNTYVTDVALNTSDNRYHADGTITLDLSNKEGKYCVKFNVTSDGQESLFVNDGKHYSSFVQIYINGNGNFVEKTADYYSDTLQGGSVYTLTLSSTANTDINTIVINSIEVFEIEEELCGFNFENGVYKSNNTKEYSRAEGKITIDLRQRVGKHKIILNDINLVGTSSYGTSIRITATGYNESIFSQSSTSVSTEKIVDGGQLYTISYTYHSRGDADSYLSFPAPQVESVLTNQTGTTDKDGKISLNMAPGKYKIKETKAPVGYEYNNQVFNVEVTANSAKSITIPNKKTTAHKITTDVKEYEINQYSNPEIIRGGTISGEDETPYEEVEHGENNTKEIVIDPDDGYIIKEVLVNNKPISINTDEEGVMRIPANYFTNMQEDKEVIVQFEKQNGILIINKVDAREDGKGLPDAEFIVRKTPDENEYIGELMNSEDPSDKNFAKIDGKYISSNEGINNSKSYGRIEINLGNSSGYHQLVINAKISSESGDHGIVKLTNSADSTEEIMLDISGETGEKFYNKSIYGNRRWYVTFVYEKDSEGSSGDDQFTINSVEVFSNSNYFKPAKVMTGDTGRVRIEGIKAGEYTVTETRAPEGYFLDSTPQTITVTENSMNELTFANNRNSKVITHYVLDGTGPKYNTKAIELINPIEKSGLTGQNYITELKLEIDDYSLVKDNNGEYEVPDNASGKFTDEDIHVYYYYRLEPVTLTVRHFLDGTDKKVANDVVEDYFKGDSYITSTSPTALQRYNYAYTVGDSEGQIEEDTEVDYYYNKMDTRVIVHYVENGTNNPLADDVIIPGKVEDQYTTSSSDAVPANYTLLRKTDNWTGTMTTSDTEVTYYYQKNTFTVTPQISKNCNLAELTDRTTQVPYVISYNATIKDYIGSVEVEIIDTLEYKIDATNSNLNGGTYNDNAKTITWNITVPDINTYNNENNEQVINITKTISLLYKDVNDLDDVIANNVKGTLRIEGTTRESTDDASTTVSLPGHLVVRYVDKYTNQEITDSTSVDGALGTSFNTDDYKKIFDNYVLVEEPDPKTGTYVKGTITKTYYYAMKASLRVQHIDKLTNQKLVDDEITNGKENDDYTTSSKTITNYKVSQTDLPSNASGKLTIVRHDNGTYTTETVVKYYYIHNAKVIENHVDIIDNRVLATDITNGWEGDDYNIASRTINGYTLVETYNNENKIPSNRTGKMTRDDITVTYYYIRPAKVIVEHIDKATNEKIADDDTINGVQNQAYTTSSKNVENYVLVETPDNKNGTMTVTVDGDGTVHDTTTVRYIYSHVSAGVIEKHIDIETGEILYNEVHDGNEGDPYKIDSRTFDGYELVETDRDSVDRLPDNAEGNMTIEPITVTYYYRRPATVRVQYIDKLTGETLTDDVIIEGYQNDPYTTSSKEIEHYKLSELDEDTPANANGNMLVTVDDEGNVVDETIVKYYYIHDAKVIEKHIDIKNNEIIYSEEHDGYEGDAYDIDAREYDKENNLNEEFEGYDLVTELEDGTNMLPDNSEGSMTRETIEVIYYYIKQTAVKVNYYDIYTDEKVANEVIINGHEGDQYETEEKDIENYEIVLKDRDGNVKYPTNTIGEMTKEIIEVNYYYIKKTSVTARYFDIVSGEEIAEQIKKDGLQGDEYTTVEKAIDNYALVEANYPENAKGQMKAEPIFVDYYYIRKMKVIVHYVDRDTKEQVADDITIDGYEGDVYHTKELDIDGYELVKVPTDKDGTMGYTVVNGEKRDYKEVTYYYALIITEPSFPQTGENSDNFMILALIGIGFVLMITSRRLYKKNQKKIEEYNKEMLRKSEIEK